MRILWNSTTPEVHSGYGIVTKNLLPRVVGRGHVVRVVTKHPYRDVGSWNGIEVMEGTDIEYVNLMLAEEGFHLIVSLWDIWRMQAPFYPKGHWAAYVPIDTEAISDALGKVVGKSRWQVAMTRHGLDELQRAGFKDAMYAPHGLDTSFYRRDSKAGRVWRARFGLAEDAFLVGSVGLNSVDDRKNYLALLMAFKKFHTGHPNSRLYLHTYARGIHPGTLAYQEVARALEIESAVIFPDQPKYDLGRFDESYLAAAYNAMDLFVLPTRGEGFGLPILEAQACGVPALLTDSTSCRELQFATRDLLMTPEWDEWGYSSIGVLRPLLRPRSIWLGLERAYEMWKDGELKALGTKAARSAEPYAWETVWGSYWKAVWERIESELDSSPGG